MSVKRWETRRLDFWDKAKEMRANWQRSIVEAEEKNELLAQGSAIWIMGFPGIRIIEDNPVGAMMAFQSDRFSRECRAEAEIRGNGREQCGYQMNCWGAMYLDRQLDGGKFPRRDMVIPMPQSCDAHTKRAQQCMDFTNVPRWQGDAPVYTGPPDPEREEPMVENVVGGILDQIESIEKTFGRKFEHERLVETLKNMWRYRALGGEVICLMQNIPTPLGQKDLYSLYTLGFLTKTDPEETLALWRMIRDEVKWRVDNQIAAVATERYRWVEAMPPPWHFLKYYRYMEQYGAVCIGSSYSHGIGEPYEWKEDGTYGPKKMPLELDMPLNNREDFIRAMVLGGGWESPGWPPGSRDLLGTTSITDIAKAFKVDGAILPLWRSGVGCVGARREEGLALSEMGVRVMYYEGSQPGDRTDLDENRMLDQLDHWMESQGLRKIDD